MYGEDPSKLGIHGKENENSQDTKDGATGSGRDIENATVPFKEHRSHISYDSRKDVKHQEEEMPEIMLYIRPYSPQGYHICPYVFHPEVKEHGGENAVQFTVKYHIRSV